MTTLLRTIFIVVLATTFHVPARGDPPILKKIPKSDAERGKAFVEAWLLLRSDIDSLTHLVVHPAVIEKWFDSMPDFLVRDMARLATEPVVVAATEKRLNRLGSKTRSNNQGRQLLKRFFPDHYRMFLYRKESSKHLEVEDDLYDTWIQVMVDAVLHGARTSHGMVTHINSEIKNPNQAGDPETLRRRLVALRDFWSHVDIKISSTSEHPTWPSDFNEALKAIRATRDKEENPNREERRISAAIALVTTLGKALGYDKLAFDSKRTTVLTPGAGRAFDGNLATSWYVKEGDTLVLLYETGRILKALHVSNSCPSEKTARISTLRITGHYDNEKWSKTAELKLKTPYFQYIPLKGSNTKRLEIEVVKIQGESPSCIAEILLD